MNPPRINEQGGRHLERRSSQKARDNCFFWEKILGAKLRNYLLKRKIHCKEASGGDRFRHGIQPGSKNNDQIGSPRYAELGPEDLPGEAAMVGSAVSLQKVFSKEAVARMYNEMTPPWTFSPQRIEDPLMCPDKLNRTRLACRHRSFCFENRYSLAGSCHAQTPSRGKGSVLLIDGNPVETVSCFTRIKN